MVHAHGAKKSRKGWPPIFGDDVRVIWLKGWRTLKRVRKGVKNRETPSSFDVIIEIESVSDFIKLSGQEAKMSGTVSYKPLGQTSAHP